jgi:probable HAF family extracellular repeat protein
MYWIQCRWVRPLPNNASRAWLLPEIRQRQRMARLRRSRPSPKVNWSSSADGTVIVGEFQVPLANNFVYHAFRWTASTGMVDLGTLGGPESRALAVNQDGSVIVGTSFTNQQTTSNHAFRWAAKTGMQDLNSLVSGSLELTFASGVSADGTVIGGQGLAKIGKFRSQTQPFRAVVPLP